MASASLCRHHQYGHCKYGQYCREQHTQETCENIPCTLKSCSKRHPKVCRYFLLTGTCKFNMNCSFLHTHTYSLDAKNHEKEIDQLRRDIESLKKEIINMKKILDSVSTISEPNTSNSSTGSCSISISQTNKEQLLILDPERIPQLDGQQDEVGYSEPNYEELFKCETCYTTFKTKSDFEKHDELQFCCDDCNICYSTQLEADLHALRVHQDEYYAQNLIPESTKIIYAKQVLDGPG